MIDQIKSDNTLGWDKSGRQPVWGGSSETGAT